MTKFSEQNFSKLRFNSTAFQSLCPRFYVLLPLFLCLTLTSLSLSAHSSKQDFQPIGFVSFDIGEYRYAKAGEIENLLSHLQLLPGNTSIILEGHSHSRGSKANQRLASIRAKSVKDKLIGAGVRAELISLRFDARNYILRGGLMHGVSVYILPASDNLFSDSIGQSKESLQKPDENRMNNPVINTQLSTAKAVNTDSVSTNRTADWQANSNNCTTVIIKTGSLRSNLEREIAECGYVMGRWKFGSEDELIDWDVPVAYSTTVDNGIIEVLQLIERNYQIRAHIHQLDKSIDFFPSI